jgi:hypothetical protein
MAQSGYRETFVRGAGKLSDLKPEWIFSSETRLAKKPNGLKSCEIGTSCRKITKMRVFSPRSGVSAASLKGPVHFSEIFHASNSGFIPSPLLVQRDFGAGFEKNWETPAIQ